MASINSPVRRLIKPVIHRFLGERGYQWFQVRGEVRDIRLRLVEEPEMALLPSFVGERDQVLDIGANFAYFTERLARLCPQGRVHAFEPIPLTHQICARIVRHFKLKNVSLHPVGVGATSGKMSFQVPLQAIGTHSAGQAHLAARNNDLPGREEYHPFVRHETFECPVVALDDQAEALKLDRLSFVKIDIEGAELYALRGMRELLARHKPVLLIEVCPHFMQGFGIAQEELREEIGNLGYAAYRYDPGTRKLSPAQGQYRDGNYILIHRDRKEKFGGLLETGSPDIAAAGEGA